MTGQVADLTRLGRCLGCRGKIKVASDRAFVGCPLCGLTLVNTPGIADLPAVVAPKAGQRACWEALVRQLDLPSREGATEVRASRLLLAPFWRHVDEAKRSVSRAAMVVSAADLSPVGLPRLTPERQRISGLEVEKRTRTGDAMGRIPDEGQELAGASVVQAMLGPGGPGAPAIPASVADSPTWWQLVYYPVWSFHYVVYNKEHFHVVDAVSGQPIGPARPLRIGVIASAAAGSLLAGFLLLEPVAGFAAALPALAISLAATRLAMQSQRGA